MLVLIKVLHTAIWLFYAAGIIALPYFAIAGRFDLALGMTVLVLIEGAILIVNGWVCPLSGWARRYTDDPRDNFDIYLPNWLARHNKTIFTILFFAGESFVIYAWLR